MSKNKIDPVIVQEIVEPVPAGGGFDDGLMSAGQGVEIADDTIIDIVKALLFDYGAVVINGGDIGIIRMQIDT